jgi:phosphatidylinositol alpha-mannosyltransferase
MPPPAARARDRWAARLSAWRERDCLRRAPVLTVPSAEFVREKLPWLGGWEHVPNPLPPKAPTGTRQDPARIARQKTEAERARPRSAALPPPLSGDPAWSAAAEDPARAAEAARIVPDRILPTRFLYLGRVEERKGVLVLVRAFLRLAGERPFASLTLVGGAGAGPYAQAVRDLIAAQPPELRARLAWDPPCTPEERPALLARFTALAAPSLWENSPYVYFEGMAAGLSCIGSATGEMKEAARATGALSPRPGDEDDWLRALRAHCDGLDARVPAAQAAYLAERRSGIPARLLAAWRKSAGAVP